MARIEHFAIFCENLQETRAFYQDVLGMVVVLDNSAAPVPGYFLRDDQGAILEIIARPPGTPGADTRYVCHVAFYVDDLKATQAKLEAKGFAFEADTAIHTPEFQTAFFRDPAGNRCQIVWRKTALGSTPV